MFILREDDGMGIRADAGAHISKCQPRTTLAGDPQIGREGRSTALDHGVSEPKLIVEFERPCLHGERPRCRSWFGGLVNDPDPNALVREPKGENEAGRSGPDDEHVCFSVDGCSHISKYQR